MREKELRLALICYGGISLAVYMHGVTKEIWRLASASRAYREGSEGGGVYRALLEEIEQAAELRLRVLVDIVAGASAGGINGIFLGQAISSGQSLEPLTELWLEAADVDVLTDPTARPFSRFSKLWAVPIAWAAAGRSGAIEQTVAPEARNEVRTKLSNFVRARWFQPPFSGEGFTTLLLDAFDAMAVTSSGPPLLPEGQPLDLIVTVTDFHGHPQRLRLNSPAEAVETEHRLTLSFTDHGRSPRQLGDAPALAFAARATASFPGAFPPFTVAELDRVLQAQERPWPGRADFLARALPHHVAIDQVEEAVLIDGSVLANAPFRPAIEALRDRPARREVDRRFVYIDPKPGLRGIRLTRGNDELPGFFQTIFGALSDIPREQPIRDAIEAIATRSANVARMRRIIETITPEVDSAIEAALGRTFFLDRPTPARLHGWRHKAHELASRHAGYAYPGYGHLKLTLVVDELATILSSVGGGRRGALREALWRHLEAEGLADPAAFASGGASDKAILFLRNHDIGFRIRRLRFLIEQLVRVEESGSCSAEAIASARDGLYATLGLYLDRQITDFYGPITRAAAIRAVDDPAHALELLAHARDFRLIDDSSDDRLAEAFAALPRTERRTMLLAYLGYPFFDIATLPLRHGSDQAEFNPIKVDRISPDDARSIREGGAEATLKGIQFNSFGAFFSRAYRENDYLWGRLHGADRLIDIVLSTLPAGVALPPGRATAIKRDAFRAILAEERDRLPAITDLFDALDREIG